MSENVRQLTRDARHDLLRPDPCPCGNPLPALQVQGRAADILTFPTSHDERVGISPIAFGTLLAQTAPTTLRVRVRAAAGADADRVWQAVRDEITRLLTEHKAETVTLERADEPPQQAPGGKYRRVIPLAKP